MKFKKLNSQGFSHDIVAVLFVMIFGIAGVAYMVASHADSTINWTSSDQWSSFLYGVSPGTTAAVTHSQGTNLNLQFNGNQTGYHTTDTTYYQYTLPANTTASSLTMNVSYVNAGFDTDFVATGTPTNMVWKVNTESTQTNQSVTINLSDHPTVIYFGMVATGAKGGVSGIFPASRSFTVNSYTLAGNTTSPAPTANFTYAPTTPTTGQSVQFTSTSTCTDTPCTYSYSGQQSNGTYSQFASSANASFTFQNAGTKVVRLIVTDAQGRTSTVNENIVVSAVAASSNGSYKLRWAPPTLSSPTTMSLSSCNTTLNKYALSTSKDYILQIPASGCGPLWIRGGHNIVMIGGHVMIPSTANHSDNGADHTSDGIVIEDATGTVHIEGILINAAANTMFDAIDVAAPSATVHVENVRTENVWGTNQGSSTYNMHADMIQTWGGDAALDVDHFTGNGDYQGFTINPSLGPTGPATIQNVDLTDSPVPSALASVTKGGGILLWTDGSGDSGCAVTPISLTNFYIVNTRGMSPGNVAYPTTTSTKGCNATLSGYQLSWPSTKPAVQGHVTIGSPPSGPYVPSGVAGANYKSPGYQ